MVIKIPSKHIYQKENAKVIDNQIGRIGLGAKAPSLIADTKNVYNFTAKEESFFADVPQSSVIAWQVKTNTNGYITHINMAYIQATPIYSNINVLIPRNNKNDKIVNILTGKDKNGSANIKYSIYGQILSGVSHGMGLAPAGKTVAGYSPSITEISEPTNIEIEDTGNYTLATVQELSYTSYYTLPMGENLDRTATLSLTDNSTILSTTAELTSDGKYFAMAFTVLCGLKINNLGGHATTSLSSGNFSVPLEGEYIEYKPSQVNISFYGDTISLNLEDNTVVVGINDSPLSFTGSELIQFTGREVNITLTNEVIRTSPVMPTVKIYKAYVNSGELSNLDTIWYNGSICTVSDINDGYVGVSVYPATTEVGNQLIAMKGEEAFNVYAYKSATNQQFLDRYYGIVKQWENGKETATLRCAIADYYTFDTSAVIDIFEIEDNHCSFSLSSGSCKEGDIIKSQQAKPFVLYVTYYDSAGDFYEAQILERNQLTEEELSVTVYPMVISKNGDYALPSTFHIYDIVIPYVYGANGVDKPLSLNKDGTAKEFVVLGKKVIYDGAVWQELYLQQYTTSDSAPPSNSITAINIQIIGVESQVSSYTKAISFQVKQTTDYNLINVGNSLRLGSITAEVTQYNSTTGRGIVNAPSGSTWEAPNTTQTVEVIAE